MARSHLYRGWGTGVYARLSAAVVGPLHERLVARLARELPPGATVLDIGSGPGGFLIALRDARADLRLIGIDPAAAAVRHARRAAGGRPIAWVRAVAEALPVADAGIDQVVATGSVKYWGDRCRAFAELRRVLAPGGSALLHELDPLGGDRLGAVVTEYPRITATVLRRFVLPGSPPRAEIRAAAVAATLEVVADGPSDGLPFSAIELRRG